LDFAAKLPPGGVTDKGVRRVPDDILLREDRGAVTHLTMNSPGNLNALSDAMLAQLTGAFGELMQSETQRVVVLRGEGKAFCAGHDLKEMTTKRQANDGGAAAMRDLFDRCSAMMQMIPRLPQPVIAQVHGVAAAAGCQLVASCDLAVAAEDARFGVNGVNIGLFCSTPMVALSRNVHRKQVFEMLTTGEFVDAARARDLGLVNRVVAKDDLESEAEAFAEKIAGKLGSAVRIGKRAFYEQIELPLDQAYQLTGAVMVENMLDRDTAEGISAFLDKRQPDWSQNG
jgi:enoyl-CoA hydratase/carnithine racemase